MNRTHTRTLATLALLCAMEIVLAPVLCHLDHQQHQDHL